MAAHKPQPLKLRPGNQPHKQAPQRRPHYNRDADDDDDDDDSEASPPRPRAGAAGGYTRVGVGSAGAQKGQPSSSSRKQTIQEKVAAMRRMAQVRLPHSLSLASLSHSHTRSLSLFRRCLTLSLSLSPSPLALSLILSLSLSRPLLVASHPISHGLSVAPRQHSPTRPPPVPLARRLPSARSSDACSASPSRGSTAGSALSTYIEPDDEVRACVHVHERVYGCMCMCVRVCVC